MPIQHINPNGLLKFDPLSQVVVARNVGSIVHVAGQSACNEHFEMIGIGDYGVQASQALNNLKIALEAAGGTIDHIISSTVYIKDLTPEASASFIDALTTAVDGKPFPAHAFSIIGVAALAGPDALIEISAVAVLEA